jgi:hypothetical protein
VRSYSLFLEGKHCANVPSWSRYSTDGARPTGKARPWDGGYSAGRPPLVRATRCLAGRHAAAVCQDGQCESCHCRKQSFPGIPQSQLFIPTFQITISPCLQVLLESIVNVSCLYLSCIYLCLLYLASCPLCLSTDLGSGLLLVPVLSLKAILKVVASGCPATILFPAAAQVRMAEASGQEEPEEAVTAILACIQVPLTFVFSNMLPPPPPHSFYPSLD